MRNPAAARKKTIQRWRSAVEIYGAAMLPKTIPRAPPRTSAAYIGAHVLSGLRCPTNMVPCTRKIAMRWTALTRRQRSLSTEKKRSSTATGAEMPNIPRERPPTRAARPAQAHARRERSSMRSLSAAPLTRWMTIMAKKKTPRSGFIHGMEPKCSRKKVPSGRPATRGKVMSRTTLVFMCPLSRKACTTATAEDMIREFHTASSSCPEPTLKMWNSSQQISYMTAGPKPSAAKEISATRAVTPETNTRGRESQLSCGGGGGDGGGGGSCRHGPSTQRRDFCMTSSTMPLARCVCSRAAPVR
mmetsp:Transcript_80440/g.250858  ORF Transcript_80440/g.250858 Transcript_80440/m.250858 type:complete len:301 (-) Transcript_80440:241-1143(-)